MATARETIEPTVVSDDDGSDPTFARFVVEPLEQGFGITLGNALRRTLLSSIPGAAITAIRIEGVLHEFSTLPGVVEDVTDVILNLKQVAVRFADVAQAEQEPVVLRLDRRGKGEVTAADIEAPPGVEIVNKGLHIAAVEREEGAVRAELEVEQGVGYLPSEKQDKSHRAIGTIPIDAIFNPVSKVAFRVEPTRKGARGELDRLILEISTNGTITPADALSEAAKVLDRHLWLFYELSAAEQTKAGVAATEEEKAKFLSMRVDDLEFSVRTSNCLRSKGISTVGELVRLTISDLLAIRNFGRKSLAEVQEKLTSLSLRLAGEEEVPEETGSGEESEEN
jgi:DNA-directed RNA polymerase subunit alpha